MTDISTTDPTRKSDLPDIYAEVDSEGNATIVANKRGRDIINAGFEKPGPRWFKVRGSNYLQSPEFRCLSLENGPVTQVMLSVAHQAGLRVMFMCVECSELHIMNDAQAERFLKEAEFFAEGVHAAPEALQ